jgi:hypothetical protein
VCTTSSRDTFIVSTIIVIIAVHWGGLATSFSDTRINKTFIVTVTNMDDMDATNINIAAVIGTIIIVITADICVFTTSV